MFTDALEAESPEYLKLVARKNDLLALTEFQRQLSCASVLSSPIYRKENRLHFTKDLIDIDKAALKFNEVKERPLSFINEKFISKNLKATCIPCYGSEETPTDSSDITALCLTQSYNDRDSLYVIQKDDTDERWYLNNYFEKNPVLKNVHETIAEGKIFEIWR